MSDVEALLRRTSEARNARDVDGVLAVMRPNVDQPNGMESGTVPGHCPAPEWMLRTAGM